MPSNSRLFLLKYVLFAETDDVHTALSLASGMLINTCVTCLVLAFSHFWALTLVILSAIPLLTFIQVLSQTVSVDTEVKGHEDKENVSKPPPRTRRSTSARPSVASPAERRLSTRTHATISAVPERDEEEERDRTPPVKKARPPLEPEEEEDEESDIQQLGTKGGRVKAARIGVPLAN